ncbi:MAG: HAMP domain-containing histidine kinase, partial [Clostridiales bacterium]|nr:HAMP domain-containing histidine kinase [Clostridiales bacterium]
MIKRTEGEQQLKRRRYLSLQTKFLLVLLLGLALGMGLGSLTKVVGDAMIDHVYLSDEAMEERCRDILDEFEAFVQERDLEAAQARDITVWAKQQNRVYLMVYDVVVIEDGVEMRAVVDSGWWDEETYYSNEEDEGYYLDTITTYDEDVETALADVVEETYGYGFGQRMVEFADGTYLVQVTEYSEEPLYEFVTILSYAVIIAVFLLVVLLYHQRTISYIIRLSQEVEAIAHGKLDGPITVRNRDETGILAEHVDTMRTSIIQEMRAEQEAWNANSDLITRMSHDIRTPLTVLLGFLELLDDGDYSQDKNYQNYLGICKKNAYQLKELADKLFQYFLVFGHSSHEMKLETTDAGVLLAQLIGEHEMLLIEHGWEIECQYIEGQYFIQVDAVYLKRLFDNLFSNIEKYADPAYPVMIRQIVEENQIKIVLTNRIRPDPNPVESTNIGLKTCERIVQEMHGTFSSGRVDEQFTVRLALPVCCGEREGNRRGAQQTIDYGRR